jgi:hypothetical protein
MKACRRLEVQLLLSLTLVLSRRKWIIDFRPRSEVCKITNWRLNENSSLKKKENVEIHNYDDLCTALSARRTCAQFEITRTTRREIESCTTLSVKTLIRLRNIGLLVIVSRTHCKWNPIAAREWSVLSCWNLAKWSPAKMYLDLYAMWMLLFICTARTIIVFVSYSGVLFVYVIKCNGVISSRYITQYN